MLTGRLNRIQSAIQSEIFPTLIDPVRRNALMIYISLITNISTYIYIIMSARSAVFFPTWKLKEKFYKNICLQDRVDTKILNFRFLTKISGIYVIKKSVMAGMEILRSEKKSYLDLNPYILINHNPRKIPTYENDPNPIDENSL